MLTTRNSAQCGHHLADQQQGGEHHLADQQQGGAHHDHGEHYQLYLLHHYQNVSTQ